MGPVMTYLLRPWHAHIRLIDLMVLWPACRDQAPNGDMEVARAAFMYHCIHDPAWRVLGFDEITRRVEGLK